MATIIKQVSTGAAGAASLIAVKAFDNSEAIAALRTGAGNLKLISWHTNPAISRAADSGSQAGEVHAITMAILGRRVVTAVRAGNGSLKLISWDVPPQLGHVKRLADSGAQAGAVSNIAIVTLDNSTVITAVRAGNGALKLIAWRLNSDGTIARLGDSGNHAGAISLVAATALTSNIVVTAVKAGNGALKLIAWNISADRATLERRGDSANQAGGVGEIAMVSRARNDLGLPAGVLTAVQTTAGTLKLIAWNVSIDGNIIERGGDSGAQAGRAGSIAIARISNTYLTSMRTANDNLKLIAFEIHHNSSVTRTGDSGDHVGGNVSETAIASLVAGGTAGVAITAIRHANSLALGTWNISTPI